MEGPSLVIATEDLKAFEKQKITRVSAQNKSIQGHLKGSIFLGCDSWGKHLILRFSKVNLRVHFLMFGSYRINNPRENRTPKLLLKFNKNQVYFYSCAIKELPKNWKKEYDWSTDLMSKKWNSTKALAKLRKRPQAQVCDVLMDQEIFSGLGNIMKNEILFRQRLHPETPVVELTQAQLKALVKDTRAYSLQFYKWKKANVLKRHWQIMRKKICPNCGGKVKKTGHREARQT